jgi:beta-mannanase
MNGNWYPWGYHGAQGVTPSQWIAAWDHVTSLINTIAGHYVTWVWAPNIEQGAAPVKVFWPRKNVQWVGLDGYFRGPHATWANTFAHSVADVESVSVKKPFIVAETGVRSTDANNRAQIGNLVAGAESARARALMYFDIGPTWSLTRAGASALARDLR